MAKTAIGAKGFLYPMPITLIGSLVGGKPNYTTLAYCGICNYSPAMIGIGINKNHHTTQGIVETGVFSVNLPPTEMAEKADYCGLVSGKEVDKGELFTTYYGTLEKAPLIQECRLSMECKVHSTIDFEVDTLFIGEIIQTHVDEDILKDGVPQIQKIDPIVFAMYDKTYWKVGDYIGKAWEMGKSMKKTKE